MQLTMSEQESTFDWAPLGMEWWTANGQDIGATPKQIRFACAKHRGGSNSACAREAGYEGNKDATRQAAYHAIRSNKVQGLLALAQAEMKGEVRGPMDGAAMRRELEKMAYGNDPNTKIRAIEALQRMDARVAEVGLVPDTAGLAEWRTIRDIMRLPNGASAALLLWLGQGVGLASLPLLHDVAANAQRQDPELWARHIEQLNAHSRAELNALLANPEWQFPARCQIWREVGVEVELGRAVDPSALHDDETQAAAKPVGARNAHNARGGSNGAARPAPRDRAEARE
jgi:hypothetical protein